MTTQEAREALRVVTLESVRLAWLPITPGRLIRQVQLHREKKRLLRLIRDRAGRDA